MAYPASEIILDNYPQSFVSEKVRVAIGIKWLAWRDVEGQQPIGITMDCGAK